MILRFVYFGTLLTMSLAKEIIKERITAEFLILRNKCEERINKTV